MVREHAQTGHDRTKSEATDPSESRFQILALDGGGVRGIFAAALLAGLEADTGQSILDCFDLVVGTSAGGIIGLGLGAGLGAEEILTLFLSERVRIFPNRLGWRSIRRPFLPKYQPDGLKAAVRGIFGDMVLGESRVPLVVPAYNLGENQPYLFKTPHNVRLRRDHRVPMWAVAMATSAAPTFFPAFRLPTDQVRLIDGGIWANNPAMVGVTEAVSIFGRTLSELRVLSIGTTSNLRPRRAQLDKAGLIRWARSPNVVDICLHGQSYGAFTQVLHLIGHGHAHRLNPPAPEELSKIDACHPKELIAKAAHHSRAFSPVFEDVFGGHVPVPYKPLYGLRTKDDSHAPAAS